MNNTDKILSLFNNGRLVRWKWDWMDEYGRDCACLLVALAPETGSERSASACPAEIMPQWLAYLTLWINDSGSIKIWPETVKRYANLAGRWHVLTLQDWQKLDYTTRAICVESALPYAGTATDQVNTVLILLREASVGNVATPEFWKDATDSLAARTNDRISINARAAYIATIRTGVRAAAYGSPVAAVCAAECVVDTLVAARAVSSRVIVETAAQAAADIIAHKILDAIEAAIVSRETLNISPLPCVL